MKVRRVLVCTVAILALMASQAFAFSLFGAKLTVYNPAGNIQVTKELAPRLATLNGKRIALWQSGIGFGTGRGDVLYTELAKEIKARYPQATVIPYEQLPTKYSPEDEVLKALLDAKPDAVVVGAGG